jgi:hypothetical protein
VDKGGGERMETEEGKRWTRRGGGRDGSRRKDKEDSLDAVDGQDLHSIVSSFRIYPARIAPVVKGSWIPAAIPRRVCAGGDAGVGVVRERGRVEGMRRAEEQGLGSAGEGGRRGGRGGDTTAFVVPPPEVRRSLVLLRVRHEVEELGAVAVGSRGACSVSPGQRSTAVGAQMVTRTVSRWPARLVVLSLRWSQAPSGRQDMIWGVSRKCRPGHRGVALALGSRSARSAAPGAVLVEFLLAPTGRGSRRQCWSEETNDEGLPSSPRFRWRAPSDPVVRDG